MVDEPQNREEKKIIERVVELAVVILLGIFPLYYKNFYSDIMDAKYQFYYCTVIAVIAIIFFVKVVFVVRNRTHRKKNQEVKRELHRFFSELTMPEWMMVIFMVVAVISTFASDYFYESFWGNEGRFSGLFLWLLYSIFFFLVVRKLEFKAWHIDVFLVSGFFVCLLGVLDYFHLDPLGFKEGIAPYHRDIFTSTLGNVNTFSAFALLYSGAVMALFGTTQRQSLLILCRNLLCMSISFVALYTSRSDNAFLGIAAIFACLPFLLLRIQRGMARYLTTLALFLTIGKILRIINERFPDYVIGMDSISGAVSGIPYLGLIVIALWLAVAVLYICKFANAEPLKKRNYRIVAGAWGGILLVVAAALLFAFYDVNVNGNGNAYGALGNYLLWNDDWGTHRGFIWRIAIENYKKFTPIHKVFGYGLDTFGILTKQNNGYEMLNKYGELYDSAHNGYLQYFITVGPIGLAAYIGLLFTSIYMMVKRRKDNPYVMAIVFAMIGYMAQETVNIDLPIAMPIFLLLMSMGIAACRTEKGKS